jgi:hypothetical protein
MAKIYGERRKGDTNLSIKNGMLVVDTTYHYQVKADPYESRRDILYTPGLPIPYQTIDPDGLGICQTTSLSRGSNTSIVWDVTARFSSNVEDNSGQNFNGTGDDPETWVPVRETFLEPYEEVRIRDINDRPWVNGAKKPFEQGPTFQQDNIRYDFWQLESGTTSDFDVTDRNNRINHAPYLGLPKHTLLLKIRRSVVGVYYGRVRRIVEYSIIYNKNNWHQKLANIGDSFIGPDGNEYPYRYLKNDTVVVTGPLGRKDYLFDEDYDDSAGKPTGQGDDDLDRFQLGPDPLTGKEVYYALEPEEPTLYFVERQVYEDLDFSTILRF